MFRDGPLPTEGVGNRADCDSCPLGNINNSYTHETSSFFVSKLANAKRFPWCIVKCFHFGCQDLTFWFALTILISMSDAKRFASNDRAETFPIPVCRQGMYGGRFFLR